MSETGQGPIGPVITSSVPLSEINAGDPTDGGRLDHKGNPREVSPAAKATLPQPVYAPQIETGVKAKKRKLVEKETNKTRPKFRFISKLYKEMQSYEEKIPVRQINERGRLETIMTPTGRVLEREVFSQVFVERWGRGEVNPQKALQCAMCVYRTCEFFNVTPEHLEEAYHFLNGKKIDGFWATDLLDRFGWSTGQQMSRDQLRKIYKKPNRHSVDIAQEKLYDIVNTEDIKQAYVDLVQDIKQEFARDLRDKVVYGE